MNTDSFSFSWDIVLERLCNRFHYFYNNPANNGLQRLQTPPISTKTIIEYLFQKPEWRDCCADRQSFYGKLLEELQKFEKSFGGYIYNITSNEEYKAKAWWLVENLLDTREGVHIDSFNYSDFSSSRPWIRHINGDSDSPIFGINLSPEEESNRPELRQFTKTSRRLHEDSEMLNRTTEWGTIPVDSAVVFGHSLNKMDYDYFFHLFTLLHFHTFDLDKMGSVQFVYKKYDPSKTKEISSRYADSVYELLSYYESCVSSFNNHILINLLRFSGKLKISELYC